MRKWAKIAKIEKVSAPKVYRKTRLKSPQACTNLTSIALFTFCLMPCICANATCIPVFCTTFLSFFLSQLLFSYILIIRMIVQVPFSYFRPGKCKLFLQNIPLTRLIFNYHQGPPIGFHGIWDKAFLSHGM